MATHFKIVFNWRTLIMLSSVEIHENLLDIYKTTYMQNEPVLTFFCKPVLFHSDQNFEYVNSLTHFFPFAAPEVAFMEKSLDYHVLRFVSDSHEVRTEQLMCKHVSAGAYRYHKNDISSIAEVPYLAKGDLEFDKACELMASEALLHRLIRKKSFDSLQNTSESVQSPLRVVR